MKTRLPTVFLTALLAALAWAAWTVTVDYYDGFEYLLTARALLGSRLFWFLRNPALSAYLALVEAPWRAAGGGLGLRGFHLAMLALNAAGALAAALWIRRVGVRVPLAAAVCVFAANRLFAHYALFAMGDIPSAAAVAACLWSEEALTPGSRVGRGARAVLLALCALGRPQAVLIPGTALLVAAARRRRWKEFLTAAADSILLSCAVIAVAYRLVGVPFAAGLPDHARMMAHYLLMNTGAAGRVPAGDRIVFLLLTLTPPGVLLLLAGLFELSRPRRRELRARLLGPAAGGAVYVLFLFAVGHMDARYLSPLIPLWALAQCAALERLEKARAWAAPFALAALLLGTAPELARFGDPFYRADRERTLSEDVAAWTGAHRFYFFGDSAPLHPDRFVFHPDDDYFYLYHWGSSPFMFFTGLPAYGEPALFSHAGWPIPYGVGAMPADTAAVSPAPGPTRTASLPESVDVIYAFRRGPRGVQERAFALKPGG